MSSTNVEWDVAALTRDLIDDEWDSTNTEKPQFIELVTENDDGATRKRVRRHNEYILFAEQGERTYEYPDLGWNSRSLEAECYAELSTATSRQRRSELLTEVERIAVAHRKRDDTPGGWDVMQIGFTLVDDENFGWWSAQVTFSYAKRFELI